MWSFIRVDCVLDNFNILHDIIHIDIIRQVILLEPSGVFLQLISPIGSEQLEIINTIVKVFGFFEVNEKLVSISIEFPCDGTEVDELAHHIANMSSINDNKQENRILEVRVESAASFVESDQFVAVNGPESEGSECQK